MDSLLALGWDEWGLHSAREEYQPITGAGVGNRDILLPCLTNLLFFASQRPLPSCARRGNCNVLAGWSVPRVR